MEIAREHLLRTASRHRGQEIDRVIAPASLVAAAPVKGCVPFASLTGKHTARVAGTAAVTGFPADVNNVVKPLII